ADEAHGLAEGHALDGHDFHGLDHGGWIWRTGGGTGGFFPARSEDERQQGERDERAHGGGWERDGRRAVGRNQRHSPPSALMRATEVARRSARTALARRSASRRVRSASTTSRKLTSPASKRFDERSKVFRAEESALSWAVWRRARMVPPCSAFSTSRMASRTICRYSALTASC